MLFPDTETVGLPTFSEVFEALEAKELTAAVLPVENSTAGVVQEVSDLLWSHQKVHVVGEHVSPIRHHLLASSTSAVVKRALSHPQALAQCATWLRDHDVEPVPSTIPPARPGRSRSTHATVMRPSRHKRRQATTG